MACSQMMRNFDYFLPELESFQRKTGDSVPLLFSIFDDDSPDGFFFAKCSLIPKSLREWALHRTKMLNEVRVAFFNSHKL